MDNFTADDVRELMLIALVHATPGGVVAIAEQKTFEDSEQYRKHELLFRLKDGVMECYCGTCAALQS